MSWEQLIAAQQEAAEWAADRLSEPPTACPYCHTPLKSATEVGVQLYCPFLPHYEYPRDGRQEI